MGRSMIMPVNIRSYYDAATLFYLEVIMGNTFNIKRYNALTDTVVEEQIVDQPELRVLLKDNNGELLVDEYTTNNYLNAQSFPVVQQPVMYELYMDSVCYDMVNTFPRIVAGHMLSLFRDRSTFRFFDMPTEEVNKLLKR